ncbi:NERD domain protein [Phycicoccus sp. Soil748]|nr:nuclease-related domain-containing protein [Phycicoccus sp. Soil748]KRE55629.1 NERD domain protein [Phycicoccus sp. Soil748]
MRLRYAGTCRVCGAGIPEKTQAVYERQTKTVRCLSHDMTVPPESTSATDAGPVTLEGVMEAGPVANAVVEPGTAGASARREFERRKAKREQRIRTQHPRIGGFLLAISEERQSTTAWDTGALGEEKLGKGLDRLACDTIKLLHDRRIPRSKANIDHIAMTANGVYVIDAKKYRGRPQLKIEGGILRPRVERLLVGSRDCTKLVDGVLKQVDVVRAALAEDVPVRGVLCFVEADRPLIGGAFTTRDVQALWPKKLYPQLQAEGPLSAEAMDDIHRHLAKALPAA